MTDAGRRHAVLSRPGFLGISALVFLLAGALPITAAGRDPRTTATAPETWVTYVDEKYGTVVSYPALRFTPEPPPDAYDGRSFTTHDGARLAVFAHFNVLDETIASLDASLKGEDYAEITYRAGSSRWFVVSGYRMVDGRRSVFYEKRILSRGGDVVHGLVITYPAPLKNTYDPIAIRIARSFGPSR